ncbi:MAG: mandelate racemase/muconate lactonizing enzyme family protein, partial [Thermoplasmata archaeon]|nr:mandelate racemase/muconate lactonizing enzyme family protein [Candidatus Sysuiplasma jiujiangense]
MKISDYEIYQLGKEVASGQTWASSAIVVRVTTSDGIVGYGEAVPTLRVEPVVSSLKEVGRVYKGRDPFDVERNRWEWYKHDFYLSESF